MFSLHVGVYLNYLCEKCTFSHLTELNTLQGGFKLIERIGKGESIGNGKFPFHSDVIVPPQKRASTWYNRNMILIIVRTFMRILHLVIILEIIQRLSK